jgi:hypothetical protein
VRTSITVVLFCIAAAVSLAAAGAPQPPQTKSPQPQPPQAQPSQPQPPQAQASQPQPPQYYRIEVAPSGSFVAIGAPIDKGYAVIFHAYPDGKMMSIRKTELRKVSPITAEEAAVPAKADLVRIRDLPMQGGSGAPAGGAGGAAASGARAGVGAPSATHVNVPAVIPVNGGLAVSTKPPD